MKKKEIFSFFWYIYYYKFRLDVLTLRTASGEFKIENNF